MSTARSVLTATFVLLSLGACASFRKTEIDGFRVMEGATSEAFDRVRSQASFDMACAKDELSLTILTIHKVSEVPDSIGVRGCGRQSTYVRPHNTPQWVQNTGTRPSE